MQLIKLICPVLLVSQIILVINLETGLFVVPKCIYLLTSGSEIIKLFVTFKLRSLSSDWSVSKLVQIWYQRSEIMRRKNSLDHQSSISLALNGLALLIIDTEMCWSDLHMFGKALNSLASFTSSGLNSLYKTQCATIWLKYASMRVLLTDYATVWV